MAQPKRGEIRGVGVGVEGDDDDESEYEIVVSWGEELYAPVQYNSFRMGGVQLSTKVGPNETPAEAHARCMKHLAALTQVQFDEQLKTFLERLRTAGVQARR